MNKFILIGSLMIIAGSGCVAAGPDGDGADPMTKTAAVADPSDDEIVSSEQLLVMPPADEGCGPEDEYYYETTSYSSGSSYLWHCVGYNAFNQYTECDTYRVCKVKKVYANYGVCVDGLLYGYKHLKSSTVTNECYHAVYSTNGSTCTNLYGGYCY